MSSPITFDRNYLLSVAQEISEFRQHYGVDPEEEYIESVPVLNQVKRITATHVKEFLICCREKFMRSRIEPGKSKHSRNQSQNKFERCMYKITASYPWD